jgi:hypothetical protein
LQSFISVGERTKYVNNYVRKIISGSDKFCEGL